MNVVKKMTRCLKIRNECNEFHELWIFQPIVKNKTKKKSENFFNLLIARNVKWCRNGFLLLYFFFSQNERIRNGKKNYLKLTHRNIVICLLNLVNKYVFRLNDS